jgi:hypothetical protein
MRHAFVYHGALERNLPNLKPGATTFEGTDGAQHDLPKWPESAFLRIGYMEKAGKKFCVVRVMDREVDVIVTNEVVIEQGRHVGFGTRFGPEPVLVEDDTVVLTLLEDLIKKNPDQASGLLMARDRLKKAIKR